MRGKLDDSNNQQHLATCIQRTAVMVMNVDETEAISFSLEQLQPLKNLAKNWDIDIASCLQEYLSDVISATEHVESNSTSAERNTNFAQAALVLQSSSFVYSRKVEYLHQLVYQSLEDLSLTSSLRNEAKGGNSKKNNGSSRDNIMRHDPNDEFLLLDDAIPMPTKPLPRIKTTQQRDGEPNVSTSILQSTLGASNFSIANSSLNNNNNNNISTIAFQSKPIFYLLQHRQTLDDELLENLNDSKVESADTATASPVHAGEFDMQCDDSYGDDNDGVGFAMQVDEPETQISENVVAQQGHKNDMRRNNDVVAKTDDTPKYKNPWNLCNPHDPTPKHLIKPLVKGRTIRLPSTLSALPSECVTGARTKQYTMKKQQQQRPKTVTPVPRFSYELFGSSDCLKLNKPLFGQEYAYLYDTIRDLKKKARVEASKTIKTDYLATDDHDKDLIDQADDIEADDDDNDNNNWGMNDYDDGGDDSINNGSQALPDSNVNFNLCANSEELHTYEKYEDDPDITYDQLCREHLAKVSRESEKYFHENDLTRRVKVWQERLRPMLEEESNRPVFDIHEYNNKIIQRVEESCEVDNSMITDRRVPFAVLTDNKPQYEVCRMFMATLCLVNARNISVSQSDSFGNDLSVELLKRKIGLPVDLYNSTN